MLNVSNEFKLIFFMMFIVCCTVFNPVFCYSLFEVRVVLGVFVRLTFLPCDRDDLSTLRDESGLMAGGPSLKDGIEYLGMPAFVIVLCLVAVFFVSLHWLFLPINSLPFSRGTMVDEVLPSWEDLG